jgi:hypothetical protein
MITRRRLITWAPIAGVIPFLPQRANTSLAIQATPESPSDIPEVLNGEGAIDVDALTALARDRIALGVSWLEQMLRPIGTFYYTYDPTHDLVEDQEYNAVRHAGTVYSLFQAHGLLEDETSLGVGEAAAGYIQRSTVPVRNAGRAYLDIQNGDTSLGGQALALVALLERRRVTGDTNVDDLIHDLATFLLWLEKDDRAGRYFNSFDHQSRLRLDTPDVVFYPGEALLALTRLAHHFPDNTDYLHAATRLANYLVHERDGDLPTLDEVPRDDHWLTIALGDLYRLNEEDDYVKVVLLQADSMIDKQYTSDNGNPDQIGGSRRAGPISNTSTATKGEAMVAAWAIARLTGNESAEKRIAEATERGAQYQMRVQYTQNNTSAFPRPEGAVGGWPGSTDDPTIRIDYVQHNLSVLIGMVHLIEDGDLPPVAPAS